MCSKLSRMQGVAAHIEKHYESMSYYHQDKKICYYCKSGKCNNADSKCNNNSCIGYTKCADYISEERYLQKIVKNAKSENKRKQKHPEAICYTKQSKNKCKIEKIYRNKER